MKQREQRSLQLVPAFTSNSNHRLDGLFYSLISFHLKQYLRMRFGSDKVRVLSSLTFIVGTVPYMGVVLFGPALALNSGEYHNARNTQCLSSFTVRFRMHAFSPKKEGKECLA